MPALDTLREVDEEARKNEARSGMTRGEVCPGCGSKVAGDAGPVRHCRNDGSAELMQDLC